MRNHPIVNGKPTTFPELAKKLGISEYAARGRYNKHAAIGDVSMRDLRALDRARKRMKKRNERIIHLRQNMRRELWSVGARLGTKLSVQRIQQIAGPLK